MSSSATAAHVLRHQRQPLDTVEVLFPGLSARARACRVPVLPEAGGLDAAVLDLGEQVPAWLPAPVRLSPTRRLPASVLVFGFPAAETLSGIWRTFNTAGPTVSGGVQLDWLRDVGTLPGHRGGPVLDAAAKAVLGVLVEGSQAGRFDRFLPVEQLIGAWPVLHRPWLMVGADQADARFHVTGRARGQRSRAWRWTSIQLHDQDRRPIRSMRA